MKVQVVTTPLADVTADALVVGVPGGNGTLPARLAALDRKAGGLLKAVLEAERFQGKPGQVTHLHTAGRLPAARLVVVGLGGDKDVAPETLRRGAAAGVRRARDLGARQVAIDVFGERTSLRQRAHAIVEGAILGTYAFDRYKREKSEKAVETLQVLASEGRGERDVSEGARTGEVFARATWFARDLVNAPANEVHPTHLAQVATRVAKEAGLRVQVLGREDCEKLGMGAFLGVAAGSQQPPRFIHLTYTPPGRAARGAASERTPRGAAGRASRKREPRRVAIIGKGITFDAGGLDLKTAEGMLRMKDDMSGAAAVIGVMRALPALGPDVEVHGLIAATENMPSGSAFRPGDVLRAMNGTTIEIGNTDAEGRLTLADALAYANARVKPDEIVDLATLTGACVVALGPLCTGLFASDQGLADRLVRAAGHAGERLWQLPLIDEYRDNLKSEVADLNNVGPRGGGAITAGLFLKEFAGDTPWAHMDIAGPAFTEKDLPLGPKGATGVAVRTLLTYLTA